MLKKINPLVIQSVLFVLTIFTTTLVGAEWINLHKPDDTFWDFFSRGFQYSIPFLGILTIHELGHYFTAKYYKVDVTLPYYIPMYLSPSLMLVQIGTLGAFIKMKSRSNSKKEVFDIGVAGPLAGFFVAIGLLYYGFTNLPDHSYIHEIHPEYEKFGSKYAEVVYTRKFYNEHIYNKIANIEDSVKRKEALENFKAQENDPIPVLAVGKNLVIAFFEKYVVKDKSLIPTKYEMYHYPFIFAGYLALFFTALNLLPMSQLDGGHVIYGLFGYKRHKIISQSFFLIFIYLGSLGIFRNNILDINFFQADLAQMVTFTILYLLLLYLILIKTFVSIKNTVMTAVVIFSLQFFTEYLFPDFKGLGGYIFVFCILIGRLLGTAHPIAFIEEPLDWKRKIVGWFTLFVFVICFIPQVFTLDILE